MLFLGTLNEEHCHCSFAVKVHSVFTFNKRPFCAYFFSPGFGLESFLSPLSNCIVGIPKVKAPSSLSGAFLSLELYRRHIREGSLFSSTSYLAYFDVEYQWRGGSTLARGHQQLWRPLGNCDCSLLCNVPWLSKGRTFYTMI